VDVSAAASRSTRMDGLMTARATAVDCCPAQA
jgi:hypothetical protein